MSYSGWHGPTLGVLACDNSCFSLLFTTGDVLWGGTSATQRRKFHTDDVNQCLLIKSCSHMVPNANLFNFTFLLVNFGNNYKVLCSSVNEFQQTQMLLVEKTDSTNMDCFVRDLSHNFTFDLCGLLSFFNNSNVTTPSTNPCFCPDSGQILRHQYRISTAESQTFLLAKHPQQQRARRDDSFRRL